MSDFHVHSEPRSQIKGAEWRQLYCQGQIRARGPLDWLGELEDYGHLRRRTSLILLSTVQLEAKKTDKPNGIQTLGVSFYRPLSKRPAHYFFHSFTYSPYARRRRRPRASVTEATTASALDGLLYPVDSSLSTAENIPTHLLIQYRDAGITGTVAWSTLNAIDGKIELDGTLAKDLKVEAAGTFKPDTNDTATKVNFYFKQPAFHLRAFLDALKGPIVTADAVLGREGFVVGGEASYSVEKAAIQKYSTSVGYLAPEYSTAVTATNNLSIFSASFFQKVSSAVQAG